MEGLTHGCNLNKTLGDEEGVGAEDISFEGTLVMTSGVGLVPVAVVSTVTEGLGMDDRDASAEYEVVFEIGPMGFVTQVLAISGDKTVPVAEVGTVTDRLGFTPALDTDTNAAAVVAVVVATVVVGNTGGWLGKGYCKPLAAAGTPVLGVCCLEPHGGWSGVMPTGDSDTCDLRGVGVVGVWEGECSGDGVPISLLGS